MIICFGVLMLGFWGAGCFGCLLLWFCGCWACWVLLGFVRFTWVLLSHVEYCCLYFWGNLKCSDVKVWVSVFGFSFFG